MPLHVELVSPEQILFSGEADSVSCRTSEGEIAFLTGHAPFVGALGIGPVTIHRSDGATEQAAVHGGFVEVSHNSVTILSDVAEMAHQIDLLRAREAAARLEAKIREEHDAEVEAALRRAHVRIELAETRVG